MTKHLRFLFVMLLAMIWSAGWAQTTIWSEDWGGRKDGTQPKNIKYDNVAYSNGNTNTRVLTGSSAGGVAPELILQSKDTWTVTIKDLKGCSGTFKLEYKSNKSLTVTANSKTVNLSNSGKLYTGTFDVAVGTTQLVLTLEKPDANNARIDDVVLTATSAGDTKTDTKVSFGQSSGETFTFTEGEYTNGTFTTPTATETTGVAGTIAYSSSNATAISVDASTGELTFLGYGEATITATFTPEDGNTYAVSTDIYKVVNQAEKSSTILTFSGDLKSFDKANNYGKPFETKDVPFVGSDGKTYIFNSNGGKSGSARFLLPNQKNNGKLVSPEFSSYINGYTVVITYGIGGDGYPSISANGKTVKGTVTGTYADGTGATLSLDVADGSAFTVTSDNALAISKIEITPNKVDETTAITLDENSESNPIEAKNGVNVTLKRTMVANEWNTICLPFDVSEKQAKDAFGNEVKIVELDTEAAVDANVLSFKDSKVITAATPYLIKPSAVSETGTYTFEGVDIAEKNINDKNAYTFNLSVDNPISFKGIYNKVDITEDVQKSFPNNYAAFLGAGNKIYKTNGSGNKTKGFRAYFAIPNGAAASALRVVIDGTATYIKNIDSEVVESNAPVYNLQGQRVNGNNLTPGIYVKAGKKFVVK